jgi:antitoxin component YwqK of YwqJK toxin-antitoxin module
MWLIVLSLLFESSACVAQADINVTDSSGLKQGAWVFSYGVLDETVEEFLASDLTVECTYRNDTLVGDFILMDSMDRVRYETQFEKGVRNGAGTFWDSEGYLYQRCHYIMDTVVSIENFVLGRLFEVLSLDKNGERHGLCWTFDKGRLMSERLYIRGRVSRERLFNRDQSISQETLFDDSGVVIGVKQYPRKEAWRYVVP